MGEVKESERPDTVFITHPLPNDGDARLQAADAVGGETGDREIDQRREQIHLDQPPVALRDLGGRAEKSGIDST